MFLETSNQGLGYVPHAVVMQRSDQVTHRLIGSPALLSVDPDEWTTRRSQFGHIVEIPLPEGEPANTLVIIGKFNAAGYMPLMLKYNWQVYKEDMLAIQQPGLLFFAFVKPVDTQYVVAYPQHVPRSPEMMGKTIAYVFTCANLNEATVVKWNCIWAYHKSEPTVGPDRPKLLGSRYWIEERNIETDPEFYVKDHYAAPELPALSGVGYR